LTIGSTIRARRQQAGFTLQRAFADRCRISRCLLAAIEADRVTPAPNELRRIADALGCDVADLVAGRQRLSRPAREREREAPANHRGRAQLSGGVG